MIIVRDLKLGLDEALEEEKALVFALSQRLKVPKDEIRSWRIEKESLDARKKDQIQVVYQLVVETASPLALKRIKGAQIYEEPAMERLVPGVEKRNAPIVVVGLGPAGLFCALKLAREGYRPIVFERGLDVDERTKVVETFWQGGAFSTRSNVQFGEGGAGAFSDGKLTTRSKDPRVGQVLKALVQAGAPAEIAYRNKPHVGTDLLKGVVKNLRQEIVRLGGQVFFNHALKEMDLRDGRLERILVNDQWQEVSALVLAPGHSARDTYEMLHRHGLAMEAKPFAVGLRVEHLQEMMDQRQYGANYQHPKLRSSEYSLATTQGGRGVYSFCMCPGGFVVNASSEEGALCVNGMSYHDRAGTNANSAIVASVTPEDFGPGVLAGMAFQRELEKKAFLAGGSRWQAPVQPVQDFLKGRQSQTFGDLKPTVTPGFEYARLDQLLPQGVRDSLALAMVQFDGKIPGFAQGIFTGVETRTSAPVKIHRLENGMSPTCQNLYPCGEGAGFAGGIMSASVDGLKIAEKIIQRFARE